MEVFWDGACVGDLNGRRSLRRGRDRGIGLGGRIAATATPAWRT